MTLKIYGLSSATCTQRVLTVLHEKGVTGWEMISMDPASIKGAEHLERHPWGRIPAIDDDGYKLFESRAICKYLAKKYAGQGTKLMPADDDLEGYGRFEKACSIETSYFDHPAGDICAKLVFNVFKGAPKPDEETIAKMITSLEETLAIYDGILAKQAYLAGDELTLADLFHLSYGTMIKDIGYGSSFDKFPHVKKWFEGLQARESWQKVPNTMEFFARMKAGGGH